MLLSLSESGRLYEAILFPLELNVTCIWKVRWRRDRFTTTWFRNALLTAEQIYWITTQINFFNERCGNGPIHNGLCRIIKPFNGDKELSKCVLEEENLFVIDKKLGANIPTFTSLNDSVTDIHDRSGGHCMVQLSIYLWDVYDCCFTP